MTLRLHVALAVVLLVVGCTKPANNTTTTTVAAAAPTDQAAVQATIDSVNHSFMQALQARDTAAVSRHYAEDAVVMMPNEPAWVGGPRIHEAMVAFAQQFALKDPKIATTSLLLSGDLAVETGTFEWTLQPKTGKAVQDKGKYMTVWKKQADGSWKIVRDINNSDLAAM